MLSGSTGRNVGKRAVFSHRRVGPAGRAARGGVRFSVSRAQHRKQVRIQALLQNQGTAPRRTDIAQAPPPRGPGGVAGCTPGIQGQRRRAWCLRPSAHPEPGGPQQAASPQARQVLARGSRHSSFSTFSLACPLSAASTSRKITVANFQVSVASTSTSAGT